MRLIDADEYEKRIKPYDTEDVMDKALYNFAHGKLIATPTAEKTGRWAWPSAGKMGRWLENRESSLRPFAVSEFMCSNCECIYDVDTVLGKPVWNYCPNCGALMEVQDE